MDFANHWFQAAGGPDPGLIGNSLRFRGSAYLSRSGTINAASTFSVWIKRGRLNDTLGVLGLRASGTNDYKQLFFEGAGYDSLGFDNSSGGNAYSINKFRDPSSWFHVVIVSKTTVPGSTMYINGIEVSYRIHTTTPASDTTGTIYIGAIWNGGSNFDGYLAELHVVDAALTPTDFAEYDDNGVWRAKRYTGSHGANGWYLDFSDPSNIGADRSGNGNNFTPTGFELSNTSSTSYDWMADSPTKNFCTLNPLSGDHWGLSNGNLKTNQGGAAYRNAIATHQIPPGSSKVYFEATVGTTTGGSNGVRFGLAGTASFNENSPPQPNAYLSYAGGNSIQVNDSSVGSISGVSAGTVLQCAYDPGTGKVWFGANNSWYLSGNPSAGTNPVGTLASETLSIWCSNYVDSLEFNFGQRPFKHTPPTGYKTLSTDNLPESTVKDGSQHFNAVTYPGSASNQAITVGFEPGLLWIKRRDGGNDHNLYNSIVGLTGNYLVSNGAGGENGNNNRVVATSSTGFTVGTGSADTNGSGSNTYVAWNWKANGTGSSNTAGSITSTVSANPDAGFSIVTYTGNGTSGATVGHGLGAAPAFAIFKARNASRHWLVYHQSLGATKGIYLSLTLNAETDAGFFNNTAPGSTVMTIGNNSAINSGGQTQVAYFFSEVEGYSKFGSYVANNSLDGPFIFTGFRPALIICKSTSAYDWLIYDNKRFGYNTTTKALFPNGAQNEQDVGNVGYGLDFLSNGFKLRTNSNGNQSSHTYIYMAFAEHPTGGANVSPSPAR